MATEQITHRGIGSKVASYIVDAPAYRAPLIVMNTAVIAGSLFTVFALPSLNRDCRYSHRLNLECTLINQVISTFLYGAAVGVVYTGLFGLGYKVIQSVNMLASSRLAERFMKYSQHD